MCWLLPAVPFLDLARNSHTHDACRQGCDMDCYVTRPGDLKVRCEGQAVECYNTCDHLHNNTELRVLFNDCVGRSCPADCSVLKVFVSHNATHRSAIPSLDDVFGGHKRCAQCGKDCQERVNITNALEEERKCIADNICDEVAHGEWDTGEDCLLYCEGDLLRDGSGFVVLLILGPLFGTLSCATYREALECSHPTTWSWMEWFGRVFCCLGAVMALVVTVVQMCKVETVPRAVPMLFRASAGFKFIAMVSMLWNLGALVLVAISRACFVWDTADLENREHRDLALTPIELGDELQPFQKPVKKGQLYRL